METHSPPENLWVSESIALQLTPTPGHQPVFKRTTLRNLVLVLRSNLPCSLMENGLDLTKINRTNIVRPAMLLLLVIFYGFLTACAGTAKGRNTSVYSNLEAREVASQAKSEASALVIIRYPAMIHANAENLYVSSFAINAIGGEVPYGVQGSRQTSRIAQSVIEKSSYYAMSLYHELKSVLPAGSVLLSPHIIDWDKEHNLYSRPILGSEQIPSVLTIDFNIYSFPDVDELMDSPPVTFGDLVTPMVIIKSGRWIQPALSGLLISSPPLASSAWRQARREAETSFRSRLDNHPLMTGPSLGFVSFLRERDTDSLALPVKAASTSNQQIAAIEQYALEKIQMNGPLISNLPEDYSVDPFLQSFVKGASSRIVKLLNSLDHDRATFFARQLALERFDPELAKVFFVQSKDESVRARLQLAEALVGAERVFLAAQSDSIYDGTYSGNYGAKMRKIIAAEYRMLEQRRKLARKQNITTAVAVIALAGSVYGAVASTAAGTASVVAASGAALAGSGWALHKSLETKTESKEVNRYFLARMAPAFDRQMSVQMEWLESKEVITARGFAEFRNKTLSLYQSRVRSMRVNAKQECKFLQPGFDRPGRWYGICEDSLASGHGYGLVMNEHGDTVEFIGEARHGMASGQGGMIVHHSNQVGASYYEGGFRDGLADGVVRIEKVGEQARYRRYKAGTDVGKADPDGFQQLSFNVNSVIEKPTTP